MGSKGFLGGRIFIIIIIIFIFLTKLIIGGSFALQNEMDRA